MKNKVNVINLSESKDKNEVGKQLFNIEGIQILFKKNINGLVKIYQMECNICKTGALHQINITENYSL